jgi:hypothetical protein
LVRLLDSGIPGVEFRGDGREVKKAVTSKDSIRTLKGAKITWHGPYTFVGSWTCDLRKLTFFTVVPTWTGHQYQLNGRFRETTPGKWTAEVTGLEHLNTGPGIAP